MKNFVYMMCSTANCLAFISKYVINILNYYNLEATEEIFWEL